MKSRPKNRPIFSRASRLKVQKRSTKRSNDSESNSYSRLEPRQMLACDFSVGSPNSGIAVSDDATGQGHIMYSNEPVADRFAGINASNADNFIAIQLDGAQWQYNNDSAWVDFEPEVGDLIVANVDFDGDTVATPLGVVNGIPGVNLEGELWFAANRFGGAEDPGEFEMLGDCTDTDLSVLGYNSLRSSQTQLNQLATGIFKFESLFQEFPNLATFDDAGTPLLSWRVQILPFIGMQDLYDQFHIDEPWNSPHNLALADQMPEVFKNANFSHPNQTVFQAVASEDSVLPLMSQRIGFNQIPDGSSNTVMLVEVNSNRATVWTKPSDFGFNPDNPLSGLGDISPQGFAVAMASGEVFTLPATIDPTNFANMVTRDGGEIIDFSEFAPFADPVNNLRQLSLAALNFESSHQHFPTNAIYSDAGEPLLSWRVAILPFLEQNDLYERFNLDEAWDSPNNIALLPLMPRIYAHPSVSPGMTNFLAISGEGTIFELADQTVSFGNLPDGSSNTILFAVADADQAVEWTKPADLVFDPSNPKSGLGGLEDGGFNVSFADGSTEFIPNSIADANLANMIQRADGGLVDFSSFSPLTDLQNNLRQIALGTLNFESANQRFPANAIYSDAGEPLLSWRVAILPFIEQGNLYDRFDLSEPWDSPTNSALIPFMPRIFATEGIEHGQTVIQAFVGADTIFPADETQGIQLGSITDGLSNTFLFAQGNPGSAVDWTRPADLTFDEASPRDGLEDPDAIGFFAVLADGSTRFVHDNYSDAEIGYLAQRNDGNSQLTNNLTPVESSLALNFTLQNNLRNVAIGMLNYESGNMRFPSHAIYSERVNNGGVPLLSWRVEILPFIGQQDLYDQFRLDEAWDSPHNLSLIPLMPAIYAHPTLGIESGMTLVQGVNTAAGESPSSIFPLENRRVDFGDIVDGSSNTLLVAQANFDQAVAWTKPEDIQYDSTDPYLGLGDSVFGMGTFIARADGSVRFLSNGLDPEGIRSLILRDDGTITPDLSGQGNNGTIVSQTNLLGDTNQDGNFNFIDISPFISLLQNGDYLDEADINNDGNVDFLDISPFISLLNTGGTPQTLLGDANLDSVVNFADISPFISLLSGGNFLDQADINRDGVVDFLDINPFISLLDTGASARSKLATSSLGAPAISAKSAVTPQKNVAETPVSATASLVFVAEPVSIVSSVKVTTETAVLKTALPKVSAPETANITRTVVSLTETLEDERSSNGASRYDVCGYQWRHD